MNSKTRNAKILLLIGCILLVCAIFAAFAIDTIVTPILFFLSVLVNSIAIMLWRGKF